MVLKAGVCVGSKEFLTVNKIDKMCSSVYFKFPNAICATFHAHTPYRNLASSRAMMSSSTITLSSCMRRAIMVNGVTFLTISYVGVND